MTGTGFVDRIVFVLPNVTGTMPGRASSVENAGGGVNISTLGVPDLTCHTRSNMPGIWAVLCGLLCFW